MFEKIQQLPLKMQNLVSELVPVNSKKISTLQADFPNSPEEYWSFLSEVGCGKIREPEEPANFPPHFEMSERLFSAGNDYYKDDRIYEGGAKGDILLFGFESTGIAFGFDTGDDNRLVEVDNYRIVRKLNIDFKNFIIGMLVCYPDFPEKFLSGKWYNDLGEEFTFPSSTT